MPQACYPTSKSRVPNTGLSLAAIIRLCRRPLFFVFLFTATINLLALSGSIFMMEVYNRVLPSRSLPTLGGLVVMVFLLLGCQGALDIVRGRLLMRIGLFLHQKIRERVYRGMIALSMRSGSGAAGLRPLKDLDTIRSFMSGQGPSALFDLPWIPLYLGILFALHPYLGAVALAGGAIVFSLTLLTEFFTRHSLGLAGDIAGERDGLSAATYRNGETVHALGMSCWLTARWRNADEAMLLHYRRASEVGLGFSSLSRTLRLMIQSGVLAVGALLVLEQKATAGVIIASSILASRALAPIDTAIAHWRGFVAARESWKRLSWLLSAFPETAARLTLPRPANQLSVHNLSLAPPGAATAVLKDVSFSLERGQALAVIGPSGSGKSSLARALMGIWPAHSGTVRLDGADITQWPAESLGEHVGYLPQQIELLTGTIGENVARFDPNRRPEDVIAAAQAAGVHELILGLPQGYDTVVGLGGLALSTGQQQRLALARALYREPFLIVLDEPNSSLDHEGETALANAILGVRQRGGIAVVISHRPSTLSAVGHILLLYAGRVLKFGPKEAVIAPQRRLSVTSVQNGAAR